MLKCKQYVKMNTVFYKQKYLYLYKRTELDSLQVELYLSLFENKCRKCKDEKDDSTNDVNCSHTNKTSITYFIYIHKDISLQR